MNVLRKAFIIIPFLRSSFFKHYNRFKFSIMGVKYGRNMRVYDAVYIQGQGDITIGNDFVCTSGSCTNSICRNIKGAFFVPYKYSKIVIGDRVGISSACIWAKESIIIGNDVNIGGDCIILDNDSHPHDFFKRRRGYEGDVEVDNYLSEIPTAPVIIEDDVWIGARCQILKGVHIGARSIIAAGSVVSKSIPSDVIAAGVPCRVIKKLQG